MKIENKTDIKFLSIQCYGDVTNLNGGHFRISAPHTKIISMAGLLQACVFVA